MERDSTDFGNTDREYGDARDLTTEQDADYLDPECVPLGIPQLDREKLYGLPKGSLVALLIDPRSFGEMFGYHLAQTGPTAYISTVRPEGAVKRDFRRFGDDNEIPDDLEIIDTASDSQNASNTLETTFRRGDNDNYVIDTISNINGGLDTSVVRRLYNSVIESDGLTYLFIPATDTSALSEEEEEVLHMADIVFEVKTDIRTDNIYHVLSITKLRGDKQLPDETIRLECTDKLSVDNTQTG